MRRAKRRSVDRAKWRGYRKVARGFAEAANVAREFDYFNAAGVFIVHSAIAYTDAITIKEAGAKSQGEDHLDAAAFLESLCTPEDKEGKRAAQDLRRILAEKTRVSYSGEDYAATDVTRLTRLLCRFRDWAEDRLTR